MANARPFDVCVLGASGYTGKFVAEYLLQQPGVSVLLAGRSVERMKKRVAEHCGETARRPACQHLDWMRADVEDEDSLRSVASQCVVLISCVGPFNLLGEAVVRACVEMQTHYVDICGEPGFYFDVVENFAADAKAAGVSVVLGCGFDCLPSQLALLQMEQWREQHPFERAEAHLCIDKSLNGNVGTLASAINGIRHAHEARDTAKRLPLPRAPYTGSAQHVPVVKRAANAERFGIGPWLTPFLGADNSMARLTARMRKAEDETYSTFRTSFAFSFYSLLQLLAWFWIAFVIFFASKIKALERWVMKYPARFTLGVFSYSQLTRQELESGSFCWKFVMRDAQGAARYLLCAEGKEPGYIATSAFVAESALTLCKELSHIPSGVLTPAIAFERTNLRQKLEKGQYLVISEVQSL